jgi:hypothetical protein
MGDIPEQRRAIEIAQMMLSELEKSSFGKPDQVTYGTFLKVCQSQMPRSDSRRRIVDLVFKKCCKEGMELIKTLFFVSAILFNSYYSFE